MEKDKTLDHDGFPIEFFQAFLDFFTNGILVASNELGTFKQIVKSLYSYFLSLIHKKD